MLTSNVPFFLARPRTAESIAESILRSTARAYVALMVAVLSVSGDLGNCESVIVAMRTVGIVGDVTRNTSVDSMGRIESGCRVLIANGDAKTKAQVLWENLHKANNLVCAQMTHFDLSYGCVFDVFGPSRCPDRAS